MKYVLDGLTASALVSHPTTIISTYPGVRITKGSTDRDPNLTAAIEHTCLVGVCQDNVIVEHHHHHHAYRMSGVLCRRACLQSYFRLRYCVYNAKRFRIRALQEPAS